MTYLELALLLDPLEKFIRDCFVLALRFLSDLSPMSLAAFVSRSLRGQDNRRAVAAARVQIKSTIIKCFVCFDGKLKYLPRAV